MYFLFLFCVDKKKNTNVLLPATTLHRVCGDDTPIGGFVCFVCFVFVYVIRIGAFLPGLYSQDQSYALDKPSVSYFSLSPLHTREVLLFYFFVSFSMS